MVIGENGGEEREIVCRGLEREGKGNGREWEVGTVAAYGRFEGREGLWAISIVGREHRSRSPI